MRWLRRWWWAVLLGLIVVVRIALPPVLRSVIQTKASEALHARVEVGNVYLELLRGGVTLEDVAVRPLGEPPTETKPGDAAADEKEPAVIAWKRFSVWMRWLPLFRKTIRLADVELVEPRIALDRLRTGDINLLALVP